MITAMKMAFDEINASDDVLPETDLLFAARSNPPSFTTTAEAVFELEQDAFNNTGVNAAIGARADNLTMAMATFFQDMDIAQVGYNPSSTMSHNDLYKEYLRVTPSNALDGSFLAKILVQEFNWKRVAVFSASDDIDSADLLLEFATEAAINDVRIVTTELISIDTTDLSPFIAHAAQFEPRVILLLMPQQNSVMFLQQAYQQGLLKEGVTVVGTTYSAPTSMSAFNATDDVAAMMKGFLALEANFNWTNTAKGQDFLQRFQALPNSISYAADGTPICHNNTDDDGSFYLYKARLNYDPNLPYVCGGIIPSTFNASNIYLFTAYAYDAIQVLAIGLHYMIYNSSSSSLSGAIMKQAMIDYISYEGVTGLITFSSGRTPLGNYGNGDRIDGFSYTIQNFNEQALDRRRRPRLDNMMIML